MSEFKEKPLAHRSRIDVIECILKSSNESSRETRLAYNCDLNLSQFNLYKEYLVKAGFLRVSRVEDGIEIFKTTRKGKEFLRDYARIKVTLNRKIKGDENKK